VVIWAHNSHLGDARATDMGRKRRKHNVGQLLREQCGFNNTFNIGEPTEHFQRSPLLHHPTNAN
jgi:erythromycin esterase-like protein